MRLPRERVYLFERDCSIQRDTKIIEEAPHRVLTISYERKWASCLGPPLPSITLARAPWSLDEPAVFLHEMNTRLQVEHPVTEMITGTDLAAGNWL